MSFLEVLYWPALHGVSVRVALKVRVSALHGVSVRVTLKVRLRHYTELV
jgi:hypothetical protein